MIDFFRTMLKMPVQWVAWLCLLMTMNMAVPLVFITAPEGIATLVAAMAGAMTMMVIFQIKGFVRLLGLGHVYWIPLVIWLFTRLDSHSPDSLIGQWLMAVIILNSLSLALDIVDVIRYAKGEREPYITLKR